jgi:ribonuclease HIII
MTRFITPPDLEFDKSITKILIRNCTWSDEQINELLQQLSESAPVDIYLYHDSYNDIQWFEGIRAMTMASNVYDCNHFKDQPTVDWLKKIVDQFDSPQTV